VEAQLDLGRLREILDIQDIASQHISGKSARKLKPEVVYLGLYHFDSSNNAHRELAIQHCVRAQALATLKLLQVKGVDPSTCMDKLEGLVWFDFLCMCNYCFLYVHAWYEKDAAVLSISVEVCTCGKLKCDNEYFFLSLLATCEPGSDGRDQ
jgi:hypothetical protein